MREGFLYGRHDEEDLLSDLGVLENTVCIINLYGILLFGLFIFCVLGSN